MLIGQLSAKSGLSRDTIRYYEKQGLIPAGGRNNPYNNYRDYPQETLERLLVIKKLKGFGFTLKEIASFLEIMVQNAASCEHVSEKMSEKVELIDKKIRELEDMKKLITQSVASCPNPKESKGNCPLITMN